MISLPSCCMIIQISKSVKYSHATFSPYGYPGNLYVLLVRPRRGKESVPSIDGSVLRLKPASRMEMQHMQGCHRALECADVL